MREEGKIVRKPLIVFIMFFLLVLCLPYFEPVFRRVDAQTTSFSDDFSTNTGDWQYLGSAYRDQTNGYVVILTNTSFGQGGAIFFKQPIEGSFTANFSYLIGGGSRSADGITMFFYKEQYTSIDNGGSLGFSSPGKIVSGYGIEFDSHQNIASDFQHMAGGHPDATGDPSNEPYCLN